MAEFPHQIVTPVPIYHTDRELLGRLFKELQEERDKNINLSRDLAITKHKNQQLECYLLNLMPSLDQKPGPEIETEAKKPIRKNESMETFASATDLNELAIQIGVYSSEERKSKILKYKEKIKKYRAKVHVSRNFSGRSVIAKIKPRVNGKFVKSTSKEELNL